MIQSLHKVEEFGLPQACYPSSAQLQLIGAVGNALLIRDFTEALFCSSPEAYSGDLPQCPSDQRTGRS